MCLQHHSPASLTSLNKEQARESKTFYIVLFLLYFYFHLWQVNSREKKRSK